MDTASVLEVSGNSSPSKLQSLPGARWQIGAARTEIMLERIWAASHCMNLVCCKSMLLVRMQAGEHYGKIYSKIFF